MKALALITAAIAALAVPAYAQHNPTADAIFLSEAISEDELTSAPRPGGVEIVSTQSFGANGRAQEVFLAEATSDDERTSPPRPGGIEVVSTQSFGTGAVAGRIFAMEGASPWENE